MRIHPILAIAVAAAFGLVPCFSAQAGALDDQLRRSMPSAEYALITASYYKRFVQKNPIDGYVKMIGAMSGKNVIIREVVEVQPNTADARTAKVLANRVWMTEQTGSRISPPVDVYVLFYNQDKADRVALVFAAFGESAHHSQQTVSNFFIEIVKYQVDPKTKPATKPAPAAASKGSPAGS